MNKESEKKYTLQLTEKQIRIIDYLLIDTIAALGPGDHTVDVMIAAYRGLEKKVSLDELRELSDILGQCYKQFKEPYKNLDWVAK